MSRIRLVAVTCLASLVGLSACGGGGSGYNVGPPPPPPPAACTPGNGTVCLTTSNTFNPSSITVTAGSSVTWNNPTGVTHNVTFSTAGAPGNIPDFSSGSASLTFPTKGTYNYHCTIHGASMSGSVTVQ